MRIVFFCATKADSDHLLALSDEVSKFARCSRVILFWSRPTRQVFERVASVICSIFPSVKIMRRCLPSRCFYWVSCLVFNPWAKLILSLFNEYILIVDHQSAVAFRESKLSWLSNRVFYRSVRVIVWPHAWRVDSAEEGLDEADSRLQALAEVNRFTVVRHSFFGPPRSQLVNVWSPLLDKYSRVGYDSISTNALPTLIILPAVDHSNWLPELIEVAGYSGNLILAPHPRDRIAVEVLNGSAVVFDGDVFDLFWPVLRVGGVVTGISSLALLSIVNGLPLCLAQPLIQKGRKSTLLKHCPEIVYPSINDALNAVPKYGRHHSKELKAKLKKNTTLSVKDFFQTYVDI